VAEEDVVAEHQRAVVIGDELTTDDEGLGEPLGLGLDRVAEVQPPLLAGVQQALEGRLILGCGDDQDVADAGQHQSRQRKIDQRLVVDRQQLLAHRSRHRM
jgi:hypothetical protein